MGRLISVPFVFEVVAGERSIRAGKRITSGFRTRELLGSFALGVNRTLRLRFFIGSDPEETAAGLAGATNLLAFAGDVDYMVGDDGNRRFPVEVEFRERGLYAKVEARNTDGVDHMADCVIVLELLDFDP